MKQMTNRQLQALETKKKLLDVSIKMIQKYGYDTVTIQQICEEAGVSVGAFYHHFQSKAGIVVASYARCDDYFENEVHGKLSNETYIDQIVAYIGYQAQYAMTSGLDVTVQIYRAQITEGTAFFLSDERALPKGLYALIEKAQKHGELTAAVPHKQIGRELLIISRGIIYNWCQCGGTYDLTQKAEDMVRNYLAVYRDSGSAES